MSGGAFVCDFKMRTASALGQVGTEDSRLRLSVLLLVNEIQFTCIEVES